jgi:hypothetical protein
MTLPHVPCFLRMSWMLYDRLANPAEIPSAPTPKPLLAIANENISSRKFHLGSNRLCLPLAIVPKAIPYLRHPHRSSRTTLSRIVEVLFSCRCHQCSAPLTLYLIVPHHTGTISPRNNGIDAALDGFGWLTDAATLSEKGSIRPWLRCRRAGTNGRRISATSECCVRDCVHDRTTPVAPVISVTAQGATVEAR